MQELVGRTLLCLLLPAPSCPPFVLDPRPPVMAAGEEGRVILTAGIIGGAERTLGRTNAGRS